MYKFNIVREETGYRFELGGINLVAEGFSMKEGKHWINNPAKAIAFFNIDGHIYGISNELTTYKTAEEFYEAINEQYKIFRNGSGDNIGTQPNTMPTNRQNNMEHHA